MWGAIATWPFSLQAVRKASEILKSGGSAMDAAEQGIWTVESDPTVDSVGLGGRLNLAGELELDAAVMDGNGLCSGSVTAIRGFEHPVSIARAVLERTSHAILTAQGAEAFAVQQGFQPVSRDKLVTEASLAQWKRDVESRQGGGHDTIGLMALDQSGCMVAATSTSGHSMKLPGRVGDSPLIGSGFYADSDVGGAVATGLGEHIMRTCCAYRLVELMRGGMHPMQAVENVVRTATEAIIHHGGKPDCIALVCMNTRGEYGAAANHKHFTYAVALPDGTMKTEPVTPVVDIEA